MLYESSFLGLRGRIFVIGGAILTVIFVIFSLLCFLNKNCLGYLLLTRCKRKKQKELSEKDSILWSNLRLKDEGHKIYLSSVSSNNRIPSISSLDENSLEKHSTKKRDSAYSSMSENSHASSEYFMGSITDCSFEGEVIECQNIIETEGPGQINFTVQYTPLSSEKETGKLILNVTEATKLPSRRYMGGACNPFVKVSISQQKYALYKKISTVKIFHTKTIRHTTSPKFDQTFIVDTSANDIKQLTVKFLVMDEDKYGNSTALGQIEQSLKGIKDFLSKPEKTSFNLNLTPPKYDSGEVYFGVNYLPTAKRLFISVLKADHLNYLKVVDDISEFYPFVRILLLSPSGRIFRKKKTTVKSNTDKPVWNQSLIFDLGPHKLENITFMCIISTMPAESNAAATWRGGCPIRSISQVGKRQDKYLGKVVLGLRVSHREEKDHWQEIINTPRKMITKWHILK